MNIKKILTIVIIIIAVLFLWLLIRGPEDTWMCVDGQWVKHGVPAAPKPTKPCPGAEAAIKSFQDCVAAGNPVMESYPRQCRAGNKTFVEDIGNELEKADLIWMNNPRPNQTITSPLEISGQARGYWYFEADFPVKLLDEKGNVLATAIAQAQADWMTEDFVPFKAELTFITPATEQGTLILEKDNPSGLPENADELRIPVIFGQEFTLVKVYFGTPQSGGPPNFDCKEVAAVQRQVVKTPAIARAALEELLKGPTEAEKADGYFTNINPGVKIQKLTIENGVAKVDFDQQLEFQVGGSCRVAAIHSQIVETLKQFPTVDKVIISIDGRTEDILQP